MTREEAKKMVDALTHEEKVMLIEFIKQLKAERKGENHGK